MPEPVSHLRDNKSGSFATLEAIRRALSFVSRLAAELAAPAIRLDVFRLNLMAPCCGGRIW